mmetsp:Transcript_121945/g.352223  ORF Transcript_121945/g.352223 Transcript_121945/m.352223 type:complete len:726 (-) Transcript_121945:218-2395(-)
MAEAVSVELQPGAEITGPMDDVPVLVSVQPMKGIERTPSDIVCVIDISWSMSMEVKVKSASGEKEDKEQSNGLSMLDIAKHAVRTIIRTLEPDDRIGIVQFSREQRVVLEMTTVDEDGAKLAGERLDDVCFGSGTNLWNGLKLGLDLLRDGRGDGRLSHLLVLTDGETEEKDSVLPRLKQYRDQWEGLPGTVSFFGFGYEIDSSLLQSLATFCDGSYAFIPDGGFVGTVFVNQVSNLMATMARDAQLILAPEGGAKILSVAGGWSTEAMPDDCVRINLGTLQYGQSKDVVIRMSVTSPPETYLCASCEYHTTAAGRCSVSAEAKAPGDAKGVEIVHLQYCRAIAVDALYKMVQELAAGGADALAKANKVLEDAISKIKDAIGADALAKASKVFQEDAEGKIQAWPQAWPVSSTERVAALLKDLEGECKKAVESTETWTKWGRHYIPSVASAHKLQQCNNFKDLGVQCYGSELFRKLRDKADEAFNTLLAPRITPARYRYLGNGEIIPNPSFAGESGVGLTMAPTAQVTMASYNNRYGVCIDGACSARLPSGEERCIRDLVKGDIVCAVGHGGEEVQAKVECAVRSVCAGARARLTELPTESGGALRVTPYHPVRASDGEWRFPVELAGGRTETFDCDAMFSILLSRDDAGLRPAALLVEGVPCAALGSGLATGAAAHPFFASQRVAEDLAQLPGYSTGLVDLVMDQVVRDAETGLVCGFRGSAER